MFIAGAKALASLQNIPFHHSLDTTGIVSPNPSHTDLVCVLKTWS